MITEVIAYLLSSLIFYVIYEYKKIHYNFNKHGIKFKPGYPIFGNTFNSTFLFKHLIEDIDAVYTAFPQERYVGFIEGMKPIILVRDPELMKVITIKDFHYFVNRKEMFPKEIEPLLGSSLLNMEGDEWRKMRSRLSGAFSGSKMKCMLPFMVEVSKNISRYLDEHQLEDIDVLDLMRRYNTDAVASTGFGLHVNSIRDRDNKFFTIGKKAVTFTFWRRMYYFITIQFPAVAKIMQFLGIELLSSEGTEFFRNIVSDTIAYRKKNNVVRPDFIHLLMEAAQDLTLDEITGQIYFAFLASYESSSSTLMMCIHELALRPDIAEKLYQEIRIKQEKFGDLNYECIMELKYMDCVLNEAARKWSVAVVMDRVCTESYMLPPPRKNGIPYLVQPGDVVYNVVNSIHMDETYHPSPDTFNSDRFSDANKYNIKSFTHMPFGMGPRSCLGMRYSMLKMKVLLYHIILNYKIVRCKRTSDPLHLQPLDFSVRAIGDTYVQFQRRP
ncbi:probable cytochrome P450 9f2 [Spodoptera litura]|uniref:unspecific monooxygenase n=1 Tax=Spodoptera litura TaxID=69820 RepID=A0A9J7IZS9_SPOLT|nr:probable cytochrome P450 9f2 [Spodoptera litura]